MSDKLTDLQEYIKGLEKELEKLPESKPYLKKESSESADKQTTANAQRIAIATRSIPEEAICTETVTVKLTDEKLLPALNRLNEYTQRFDESKITAAEVIVTVRLTTDVEEN